MRNTKSRRKKKKIIKQAELEKQHTSGHLRIQGKSPEQKTPAL